MILYIGGKTNMLYIGCIGSRKWVKPRTKTHEYNLVHAWPSSSGEFHLSAEEVISRLS
jgi:hypothetical protein